MFKVGDRVIIMEGQENVKAMNELVGMITRVTGVSLDGESYSIDIDSGDWAWGDNNLALYVEESNE